MSYKYFALAGLYFAAMLGLIILILGRNVPFESLIAVLALIFTCALALSSYLYIAPGLLPKILYLLACLMAGSDLSALREATSPYASYWHYYLFSEEALVVNLAFISAWLYAFTFTNFFSQSHERSEG